MTENPRKHRYSQLNPANLALDDALALKSVFIDLIQSHHAYYVSTSRSLYGGSLNIPHLRFAADGERNNGVLVDLDYPRHADPHLWATKSGRMTMKDSDSDFLDLYGGRTEGPSPDAPFSELIHYNSDLRYLVCMLCFVAFASGSHGSLDPDILVWWDPCPFKPQFSSMSDTWFRPLWRLVGDEYFLKKRRDQRPDLAPVLPARLTYENVLHLIEKDVGSPELVFRAALRVPLPPSEVDELSLKPAFQCLIHIETLTEFRRAIVDIAKAITEFGDASVCFPALTPGRMLFQQRSISDNRTGFVLDLDLLEEPNSLTACAGARPDPRVVRYAAYDLISMPTFSSAIHPRHALESLFHVLVWFCLCNEIDLPECGLTPRRRYHYDGQWFNPEGSYISADRTAARYQTFVQKRRTFLLDWKSTFGSRSGDVMCKIMDDWLAPLWKLVGEAQFFSRWREGQDGYDWATLGGYFTVDKFMAILEGKR